MIQAVQDNPIIRPEESSGIQRVRKPDEAPEPAIRTMHICRLTGMRLEDCQLFCWAPAVGFHYPDNLNGRLPMLTFSAEQTSGEEERIPLTPHAIAYLRSIQKEEGFVCRMVGRQGEHETSCRLGRVIANAGRAAGIVVKATGRKMGTPKWALAHDLRVAESIPEQVSPDQDSQYGPEFLATLRAVKDKERAKNVSNWMEEGF